MGLEVVVARCFPANRVSVRVIEKLGFRFVGLEASPTLKRPAEPVRRYELTRRDWRRAPVDNRVRTPDARST